MKTALEQLKEKATRHEHPACPGLVRISTHLIELWKAAESETGDKLTPGGNIRPPHTYSAEAVGAA